MRHGQIRDENLLMTQRHLHAKRQTQVADENSQRTRENQAWATVDELNEECDQLTEEVQSLRDQLSRSKALNRLVLLQKKGLIQAIGHLKQSWEPKDQNEVGLKEDINPLVRQEIGKIEANPAAVQEIEQEIERQTAPAPRPR